MKTGTWKASGIELLFAGNQLWASFNQLWATQGYSDKLVLCKLAFHPFQKCWNADVRVTYRDPDVACLQDGPFLLHERARGPSGERKTLAPVKHAWKTSGLKSCSTLTGLWATLGIGVKWPVILGYVAFQNYKHGLLVCLAFMMLFLYRNRNTGDF